MKKHTAVVEELMQVQNLTEQARSFVLVISCPDEQL